MSKTISREELKAQLGRGDSPVIVEALPLKYYRHSHLPGALHLPHDQVRERAEQLFVSKDEPIVVYCANAQCRNSHIAAAELERLGYTDVAVYAGGKQDWIDAGYAIERGREIAA